MATSERRCAVADCERPYSSRGYCALHAERVRRHGHPGRAPRVPTPLSERLGALVDQSAGPDACWPFLGALTAEGYGRIRLAGSGSRTVGAHRGAWIVANPEAIEPEVIDHACHDPDDCTGGPSCPHRRCCNPAHLRASTVEANSAPDRQWTKARWTHCIHGHEFTPENTYVWPGNGTRSCRACDADRHRLRRKEMSK